MQIVIILAIFIIGFVGGEVKVNKLIEFTSTGLLSWIRKGRINKTQPRTRKNQDKPNRKQ